MTAGEDEYLHIYDVRSGTHKQRMPSQKYGAHLARFTHDNNMVIFASTKGNNGIRYMNLKTKVFMRYFEGHENKVVSLQMSPQNDTFLSGSVDESIRLWDLRAPQAQGQMHVRGHPVVAYDPTGKVFALAINERSTVLLYDLRQFFKGPFSEIYLDDSKALSKVSMPPRVPIITSLTFSSDSKYLLVGTSGDAHYVIDTFPPEEGVAARLVGHQGLEKASGSAMGMVAEAGISGQEVCWTPDGKWVMSGSADGSVKFWYIDLDEARRNEFRELRPRHTQTGHEEASRVLAFNPRHAVSTTALLPFSLEELTDPDARRLITDKTLSSFSCPWCHRQNSSALALKLHSGYQTYPRKYRLRLFTFNVKGHNARI